MVSENLHFLKNEVDAATLIILRLLYRNNLLIRNNQSGIDFATPEIL